MKTILVLLCLALLPLSAFAFSVEDVVQLSQLKTSDSLIIETLQKEKLDKPVTSKDVIYMKENGVSERVIEYVLNLSRTSFRKTSVPQSDKIRVFTTTNEDGKKVTVLTNLDKEGKRIGGELPASERQPAPVYPKIKEYEPPQEIHVTIHQEPDVRRYDNVVEPVPGTIYPSVSGYSPYPYYPYQYQSPYPSYPYPYYPLRQRKPDFGNGVEWQMNARDPIKRPHPHNPPPPPQQKTPPRSSSSASVR